MATLVDVKHDLIAPEHMEIKLETIETAESSSKSLSNIEVACLPTSSSSTSEPFLNSSTHSTYHIYTKRDCHKNISLHPDPSKDRRAGPRIKELKAQREEKQSRKASGLPPTDPDPTAFYLHRPYLAFHIPPHVLYTGSSKYGTRPAVLIHSGCFWREYKLQLGPSIAEPGVLDPRGVVCWKHNGGDKTARKADDRKLKGYKVRTWRLWCETGKEYVKSIGKMRKEFKNGKAHPSDPDVLPKDAKPTRADEVVYLRWTSPLSRHTRRYHFHYRGIDFYWKGTGTVKESRMCGMLLRFNHLKLVARLPLAGDEKDEGSRPEVCLGKFTSSVAKMKSGTLELFDTAILRLVEEHAPSLLELDPFGDSVQVDQAQGEDDGVQKISRLKKSTLYQVIVATATCMIASEKEKRHTIMDLIVQAAEGGGGAGG